MDDAAPVGAGQGQNVGVVHTLRIVAASLLRFLVAVGLVWGAASPWASAAGEVALVAKGPPIQAAPGSSWWIDPTGQATLESVIARQGGHFQPMEPQVRLPLKPGQALWIQLQVGPAPTQAAWFLRIDQATLDRVTLWSRSGSASSVWSRHEAGDTVPLAQRSVPAPVPVLPLAVQVGESTTHYLRIESREGFAAPMVLQAESDLLLSLQRVGLASGIYLGAATLLLLGTALAGWRVRDPAYAWYCLYLAATALFVVSGTGFGGMVLWPHADAWNDASTYVFGFLAAATWPAFLWQLFDMPRRAAAWTRLALVPLILGVGAAALTAAGVLQGPGAPLLAVSVTSAVVSLLLLRWAWRRRDPAVPGLLIAYLPLLCVLPLPIARVSQWIPLLPWARIAMAVAFAWELCVMLLVLARRSQQQVERLRRIAGLDRVDPLTGLDSESVLAQRLEHLVVRVRSAGHSGAVYLLEIANLPELLAEHGPAIEQELLVRLAHRLGRAVGPSDTVARHGDRNFVVLVEGPLRVQRAQSVATRLVANMLRPLPSRFGQLQLRPRLAWMMVPVSRQAGELVPRLQHQLGQAGPSGRTIFTIQPEDF